MKLKNSQLLLFIVALNISVHMVDLPIWVSVVATFFIAWKFAFEFFGVRLPNRKVVYLITATCFINVCIEFGTPLGQEPSTALLVLMVANKLFEIRGYRDTMIINYLCYMLLMAFLISYQTIFATIYMVIDIGLITSVLALHHAPTDKKRFFRIGRRSAFMMIQAIPIVIALFFLFPRFKAGLWKQKSEVKPQTGFSERMDPGSVSELALSDEKVFRVEFKNGVIPPRNLLYWRGAILADSFGLKWRRGSTIDQSNPRPLLRNRALVEYEIYMEPTNQVFMFGLDWPTVLEFGRANPRMRVFQRKGMVYESRLRLSNRVYYRGYSYTSGEYIRWDQKRLDQYLQVGNIEAPKTLELVQRMTLDNPNEKTVVSRILNYFGQQGFKYSLQPPKVSGMDEFLFDSKRGFCEHFASTMATMLRLANVPSRVVIGYQGGTMSALRDYLIIKQMDAHAWLEYWNRDTLTWNRVDPTLVVQPERILMGFSEWQDRERGRLLAAQDGEGVFGALIAEQMRQYLEQASLLWDQVESQWNTFLLRYDFNYQKEVFRKLGIEILNKKTLFQLLGLILMVIIFPIYLFHRWRKDHVEASLRLYRLFCERLEKVGIQRNTNEGPISYMNKIKITYEDQAQPILDVFDDIMEVRYRSSRLNKKTFGRLRNRILIMDLGPASHSEEVEGTSDRAAS